MSKEFQPSVTAAKNAMGINLRIEQREHPAGAKGAAVSLEEVAKRIREGRLDPRIRAWAGKVLMEAGKPKGELEQAQAILDAVRKQTMYVADPVGAEYMVAAKNTLCLDEQGLCIMIGDCFPKGTLLLTENFDLIPIENIEPGIKIWGRDKWTTVKAVADKGVLPVDAIFLNNGSVVQLTEDHHVYVARCPKHEQNETLCSCDEKSRRVDRIKVKELQKNDVLITPERLPFGNKTMDPDIAYVEGLFVSDGWAEGNRFSISGQDGCPKEEQKREVKNICNRLGIETRWNRKYITINDNKWTRRMELMGHRAPNKHLLSINLDEAAAIPSLRGVMADSGKNTNGPGRTFTSTSKLLTIQTRVLHKMCGITCSIRYIENHGGLGENPIWRLGVRVTDRADGYHQKILRVKNVEKNVAEVQCFDIQTEDHYVYLPEHDVTVSNCDDLVVATGSALMSVGLPIKVIGQSFDNSPVPSHVMLAVQTKWGWKKIDPSSSTFKAGESFPATKETWLDPMDTGPVNIGAGGGDFVGVGHLPSAVIAVGVGDLSFIGREEIFNTVTSQLRTALATLEDSVNKLGNALHDIEQTRTTLTPDQPFDPEPFSITGLDNFPTNGLWTRSMATISVQIWTVGKTLVHAGHEALDGARRILVDQNTNEVYVEAKNEDPWRIHTIVDKVTDSIVGFFSSVGELISGFTEKDGKALTKEQIDKEIQTPGVHGVGAVPIAVIVAGVAVTAAIASVAIYYIVAKQCDTAQTVAREAANKAVVECITAGKCPASMLQTLSQGRVDELNAEANKNRTDPLGNTVENVGKIITWTVIGGVAAAGIYVALPMLKALASKATDKLAAKENPISEKIKYRGFDISVEFDNGDWIADITKPGEKEPYMPNFGMTKDVAIKKAKIGIDKVIAAIERGEENPLPSDEWHKYFLLGRNDGYHDLITYGFGSDIIASANAHKNLPKNYDTYIAYARGYIDGSKMPNHHVYNEIDRITYQFSKSPHKRDNDLGF